MKPVELWHGRQVRVCAWWTSPRGQIVPCEVRTEPWAGAGGKMYLEVRPLTGNTHVYLVWSGTTW